MQNIDLSEMSGTLKSTKNYYNIKMDEETITFGDIEIEKQKVYRYKTPLFLEDINTDNKLVSNKISSNGKKR